MDVHIFGLGSSEVRVLGIGDDVGAR